MQRTNRGGRDDGPWHHPAAAATAARVAAAVLEAAASSAARAATRLRAALLLLVVGSRVGGAGGLNRGAGHAGTTPTHGFQQPQPFVAHLQSKGR